MLIVSSLPPRGRLIRNGYDVQAGAIGSWRKAGFTPISVNARAEGGYGGDVEGILAERNATDTTGRPQVYLSDLLRLGARRADRAPFAITNADILLEGPIAEQVSNLREGHFLFAQRRDVSRSDERPGEPYPHGLDFFVLHPKDAVAVAETRLIFGVPWWDHYLPIALAMRGCIGQRISDPIAFHIRHDDRWDWALWEKLGCVFLEDISKFATGPYRESLQAVDRWGNRTRRERLHQVSGVNEAMIQAM